MLNRFREGKPLSKQKHLLLEYAQSHKMMVDQMIEVETSSMKDLKVRKIDLLLDRLAAGDTPLDAVLSALMYVEYSMVTAK